MTSAKWRCGPLFRQTKYLLGCYNHSVCFSIISESGNAHPLIADPSESFDGANDVVAGVTEPILKVCKISYLIHRYGIRL